jgi:NAD(P)-dependent dehydrogenase (short-subunit alcohol dehydrogenase family)
MKLEAGQVAVVTGGASGIGLALARAFGAHGLRLMLADIEADALATAADGLRVDGFDVQTAVVNVADADAVEQLAERTYTSFGSCNVICNNAGVVARHDAWDSLADWKWVIDVDLWGVIHGVTSFVPRMRASGEPGHVVNTASVAGLLGFPGIASYTAAKHAVVGLSTSLHHELASSALGVSVLCPGLVATNIVNSERNHPDASQAVHNDNPTYAMRGETLPPDAVADEVVAAVSTDRFWVLPHEHYADQAIDLATQRKQGESPQPPQVRF